MDVVKNLVDYLTARGIKQTFVAEKCGWNRQKVNAICAGKQGVSMDDYIKICDALGISYDFLFNYEKVAGVGA